jgi:hypothetical protein
MLVIHNAIEQCFNVNVLLKNRGVLNVHYSIEKSK